jgi:hypothetical protein
MNEDAFILDDVAWTTHESGQDNRTLIVTEGNRFLETVLGVLPGLEVFRASPEQDLTAADAEPYDLYVFDGVQLPDPLPASDMLIINPQPGPNDLSSDAGVPIGVSGFFSNTNVVRVADSPLLQFVDWSNVHVRQAQEVDAAWAQPLVTAEGGPLLLTGEREGHRIAILTFSLQESDLPLQIAFPVLMANIMGWLSPGRVLDTATGLRPGDPVAITPGAGTTAVTVLKPDNSEWTEEVGTEALLFAETGQLGLYEVSVRDAGGDRPAGSFAVNLFDSSESAIQPAEVVRFGQTTLEVVTEEDVGQRELWPWLATLAFIVLLGEWWAYHRGLRLPQLPDRQTILDRFGRH